MHPPGLFQLLVIVLIILVLFGRGKVSAFMGDFGKGVKNFRNSLADDEEPVQPVHVDGPGQGTISPDEAVVEPHLAPDQTHQ